MLLASEIAVRVAFRVPSVADGSLASQMKRFFGGGSVQGYQF
jgi:hypothetical protein